jgi:uncharacterized protein
MEQISKTDIRARLQRDNPWWSTSVPIVESSLPKRVYFAAFKRLALNFGVKRAAILLGPRRVGKTVMLKQIVHEAIVDGLPRDNVFYASIDTPLYSNISLASFLSYLPAAEAGERCLAVFDEIQYLKDWQVHLKDLVDSYPNVKFIASGSAAAALSLQSKESGAGRFSDFMLPPLTFCEFVEFSGRGDLVSDDSKGIPQTNDINALNAAFVDYLNYGGYPEAVFNEEVRNNPDQFIRVDIVEKVLLKDLPSLYGIDDIQELNKLFMFLAYNAGQEASYEKISQTSGITKATIRKYIEYLESAFLILKLPVVNDTCKSMQRERNFKVYLNNPSMRSALFSPVSASNNTLIGHLAECAVFAQWQHALQSAQLRYARWRKGEVDIVYLGADNMKPSWIGEIKWSDNYQSAPDHELKNLKYLFDRHDSIRTAILTTRTIRDTRELSGRPLNVWPTALYSYMVGRNTTSDQWLSRRYGQPVENNSDESELEAAK